jgi:hypothetical protein
MTIAMTCHEVSTCFKILNNSGENINCPIFISVIFHGLIRPGLKRCPSTWGRG